MNAFNWLIEMIMVNQNSITTYKYNDERLKNKVDTSTIIDGFMSIQISVKLLYKIAKFY